MKKAAPEPEIAAGNAEQDAHRRSAHHIVPVDRMPATKVVAADRDAVEAHQDVSQIGPCVGSSAEERVHINPFRISGAPKFAALAPSLPCIAILVALRKPDQD